jgi:hypothetical protein
VRISDWINLLFFPSIVALAHLRPLPRGRRIKATALGAAGTFFVLASQFAGSFLEDSEVLRDWLPAPLMILAYRQAGELVKEPNAGFQTKLEEIDRRVLAAVERLRMSLGPGAWLAGCFELSYLLCYPLVPLGVGLLYLLHLGNYVEEYWKLVLSSSYPCYLVTAFLPTLPPRLTSVEGSANARPGQIRSLNLWILRRAGIGVNTFPSAHVASTLSASLALVRFVPGEGLIFLCVSIGTALGAVLGRYHYAADAFTGAALATGVVLLDAFLGHG